MLPVCGQGPEASYLKGTLANAEALPLCITVPQKFLSFHEKWNVTTSSVLAIFIHRLIDFPE